MSGLFLGGSFIVCDKVFTGKLQEYGIGNLNMNTMLPVNVFPSTNVYQKSEGP